MRFFVEPVQLISMRNLGMIEYRKIGPLDFKAALDVEVHAKSTVFCLPNLAVQGKGVRDVSSGLCLHGDFTYLQAWRGFLNVGPGKITQVVNLQISSIFISPLREIRVSGAESLIDACIANFTTEFMVVPDDAHASKNSALIAPWINLDAAWAEKKGSNNNGENSLSSPSGLRLMSLEISKAQFGSVSRQSSSSTRDHGGGDDDEDGDTEEPEWVTLEDKVERGEMSIERSSTQIKVSLKDILFVHSAISQLQEAMSCIPVRPPLNERFFVLYNSKRDLEHVPMLTHYLVHTSLTDKWIMRNNDVVADICSFRALLRNNTYNIRIAKINLTNLCFSYNHSLEHLHMASGLTLSVWTHNEAVDKWEPVVETVTMSAIGATDTSHQQQNQQQQQQHQQQQQQEAAAQTAAAAAPPGAATP
jgi:hypothetical protein